MSKKLDLLEKKEIKINKTYKLFLPTKSYLDPITLKTHTQLVKQRNKRRLSRRKIS